MHKILVSMQICMQLVDKFCYLGDMSSVDGNADAAVETRIRIGWKKFRQLVPLLTNKDISLIVTGDCTAEIKTRWHFSRQRCEWLDGCVA